MKSCTVGTLEFKIKLVGIFIVFSDLFMARLQNDKNGVNRLKRYEELVNRTCDKAHSKK